MDIEVRHARVVTAITTAGSISRAAAVLDLPQPSLSAQLRRIERSLGGPLFVRSVRGLRPTPLGERLVPLFAELARQAESLRAEAERGTGQTVVRFGHPGQTPVALARVLHETVADHHIQTYSMTSDAIVDAVVDGSLTAGLVTSVGPTRDPVHPGLRVAHLGSEPVCVLLPTDHPLADRASVTVDEVIDLSWIRRAPGDWYRVAEDEALAGAAPSAVLHHAGGHAEAARWAQETGSATLMSPWFVAAGMSSVRLAETTRLNWDVIWRIDALSDATAAQLADGLCRFHRSQRDVAARRPVRASA